MLRGVLGGIYGTVAFYVVIHVTLAPYGLAAAVGVAIATALAIQAAFLQRIRRTLGPEPV